MKAIILDIPTTQIFNTPGFTEVSDELKKYRLYDQKIKLENGLGIKFSPPNSYNRGLLFIAAILEKRGIEVKYYNSDYDNNFWDSCKNEIDKTDFLLASAKTNNYPIVLDIFKNAKNIKSDIKTIIGGPHPTALPMECLEDGSIDYIVRGEGEETIKELCDALINNSKSYDNILGLAFKKDGKIYINELRPLISDLNILPMPAYHLLPGGLKSYHVYIDTSRGCIYNCGFCSGPNYWRRKIRTRSFNNFYKELLLIKSLIGDYNFLHISDPMLGVTKEQIGILKKLKNKNKNLLFSCDVKANYVKDDLIQLMINCGVRIFSLGIETLNNQSLKLIGKNCTAKAEIDACKIIKRFKEAFLKSYWILGLPGETKRSLQFFNDQVYDLLKNELVDQICSHILVPYPGTEFYNNPEKFGLNILHKNWINYEGRSFPLVYELNNLTGEDIYDYFLQTHNKELSYYKEKYPKLINIKNNKAAKNNLSFAEYKGRLV